MKYEVRGLSLNMEKNGFGVFVLVGPTLCQLGRLINGD